MRIYPLVLAANTQQFINARGAFLRGISGTAVYDLEAFDNQGNSLGLLKDFQTALAVEFKNPDGSSRFFDKVGVTSATAQTISVLLHDSFVDDNRLTGIVNITGGLSAAVIGPSVAVAPATVSVGVAATLVIAAHATTKRGLLRLQNMSTASIYVGFTNAVTTANGICLDPSPGANRGGGYIDVAVNCAVYAIATAAASDLRVMAADHA